MTTAYLNGQYMPITDAKISPMDRGFLFGDGIYEVIPSYAGKLVGGDLHAQRMRRGLVDIGIEFKTTQFDCIAVAHQLIKRNTSAIASQNIGIYIHISRGADDKRLHAFPSGIEPTVFAFAFEIPSSKEANVLHAKGLSATTCEDMRWKRCHIKSTSLLGNVMHFQQSQDQGVNETILYNEHKQITEASVSNVFMVKQGVIATPPLDNQLLPGITRHILIESVKRDGQLNIEERSISLDELLAADEVWLTSSSKEVAPVIRIDDQKIGSGAVGKCWELVTQSYNAHKFSF